MIPCVISKAISASTETPTLSKCKYIVPKYMMISNLKYVIQKRINLKSTDALFFFVKNHMVSGNKTVEEIRSEFGEPEGHVIILYSLENTFG
jgi:hypothetical protein